MLIENLGPYQLGLWLIFMAITFALMNWVAHLTMRRARGDSDNAAVFSTSVPAQLHDFFPGILIVSGLLLSGVYISVTGDNGIFAMVALLATNGSLAWQFGQSAMYWRVAIAERPEID